MRKKVFFSLLVILLLFVGLLSWYQSGISAVASEGESKSVEIASGSSVREISEALHEAGLIRSSAAFQIYVRLQGVQSQLQAGTYVLSTELSVKEIVQRLSDGDVLKDEIIVIIPEGFTNAQIADRLASAFGEVQDASVDELRAAFLDSFADTDRPYAFLENLPAGATLEGFLFPDTYRFFKNASTEDVTTRFLDTFAQKVPAELRAKSSEFGYTFFEMLTLASIVERELQTSKDRKLAADLFLRRLEIGQALQSDATVNYVTGKRALRPSLEDISVDNPYNTYENPGLPPGPISNPGLDAIDASLNPTPNEFFYFLTDADNVAHFARTFAEHSQNIQQYLD